MQEEQLPRVRPQVIPQPCEICTSRDTSYRSYLKQWICHNCRKNPDQLVLTMNNMIKKYHVSKTILLAAYMISEGREEEIKRWQLESEEDKKVIQALPQRKDRFMPINLYTLPNPYRNIPENVGRKFLPPMRLMKDLEVYKLARTIYGEAQVARFIQEWNQSTTKKRPAAPSEELSSKRVKH